MKVALQQYKPSGWYYALGYISIVVVIADILVLGFADYVRIIDRVILLNLALHSIGPATIFVIAFLPKKMVVIDTVLKTMHTEYVLFSIRLPIVKQPLPNIDYISAFCQLQSDADNEGNIDYSYVYDINLWYGNKHIKLCSQYTPEEALQMGKKLAAALNCNLLDATRPFEKEWITPYKNSGINYED